MNEAWKEPHEKVIKQFLRELNEKSDAYILKGGTALKQCYGLDRFSEDIDLDAARKGSLKETLDKFCDKNGFSYTIKKDTDTVKRYMLDYRKEKKLKIEVSYRRKNIPEKDCVTINGIKVYDMDNLTLMKANAYMGRDKIRDLYDLTYICDTYFDKLSDATKSVLRNAVEYKGIEQFDYIVSTQQDELINTNKLAEKFLKMYERLDLLVSKKEHELINHNKKVQMKNYDLDR